MVRLGFTVVLVLAFSSCGALTPARSDAGSGGASGGSGGSAGSGGAVGGNGGAAGGSGGTAGGTGGGAGPAFTFANVAITQPGSLSVMALAGTTGDVWAYGDDGYIYRSTGGGFTRTLTLAGFALGLHVDGAHVFALNADSMFACLGTCTNSANYVATAPGTFDALVAMCGRGSAVYATANTSGGDGKLYGWNGSAWAVVAPSLSLRQAAGCAVDEMGTVYVAGLDGVARLQGGSVYFERVSNDGLALRAVAAVGGEVHAVGNRYRIARRTVAGTWTVLDDPLAAADLLTIGGPDGAALFSGGYGGSAVRNNWYQWDGSTWTNAAQNLTDFPANATIRAIWATGPNEFYVGGLNSTGPVLVRATR